jgi:hypothetical protein
LRDGRKVDVSPRVQNMSDMRMVYASQLDYSWNDLKLKAEYAMQQARVIMGYTKATIAHSQRLPDGQRKQDHDNRRYRYGPAENISIAVPSSSEVSTNAVLYIAVCFFGAARPCPSRPPCPTGPHRLRL